MFSLEQGFCPWCSHEVINEAMQRPRARATLFRTFKTFTDATKAAAPQKIPAQHVSFFQRVLGRPVRTKFCSSAQCLFSNDRQPARVPSGATLCPWCISSLFHQKVLDKTTRKHLSRSFRSFSSETQKAAITRVPAEYQYAFRKLMARGRPLSQEQQCHVEEALRSAPAARGDVNQSQSWTTVLDSLRVLQAAPKEAQQMKYRTQVLDDRALSRRTMRFTAPRVTRGESVDNGSSLPPASRSLLAVGLHRWCLRNSWASCEHCGMMNARAMTTRTLFRRLPATIPKSQCKKCRRSRVFELPSLSGSTACSMELRNLPEEIREALSPLQNDVGTPVYAANGYRNHVCMIRFRWKAFGA